MPRDTYMVTIEVEVELHAKSMVVHNPGSCASAVRANLMNILPTNTNKMGLRYRVETVHVEAQDRNTNKEQAA